MQIGRINTAQYFMVGVICVDVNDFQYCQIVLFATCTNL